MRASSMLDSILRFVGLPTSSLFGTSLVFAAAVSEPVSRQLFGVVFDPLEPFANIDMNSAGPRKARCSSSNLVSSEAVAEASVGLGSTKGEVSVKHKS